MAPVLIGCYGRNLHVMRISLLLACMLLATGLGAQTLRNEKIRTAVMSPAAKLYYTGSYASLFPEDPQGKVWVAFQFLGCNPGDLAPGASVYGDVAYARLSREQFRQLCAQSCIVYLDVCGRLNAPRPLNDTARVHSFVNQVHDGLSNGLPANYTGRGVVAGIVDIGFQTGHPTFYNADGTGYRVKRFWHQNTTFGAPPTGFGYGGEFTVERDILAMRDDDGSHGTHVAGTMAGSGFTTPQNRYRGMSPEADMVFVTIRYTNDTLGGSALGDYIIANPTVLDGYRYIFNYADSRRLPAVTNLSWGMHTGPHDGTSLFDRSVETMVGPGKIIVGANGNDAGNQMHVQATLTGDTAYTFAIDRNRNEYARENIYCDFWGPAGKDLGLNISVFDTLGNLLMEEPFVYSTSNSVINRKVVSGSDTLTYTMACQARYVNNDKANILLMAETSNAAKLRIRIGMTADGTVHGWNSGQTRRWTSGSFLNRVRGNDMRGTYVQGGQASTMSENGGTGRKTISVGSYINRKEWIDAGGVYRAQNWLTVGEVSGFSSRGPTPDGRMKPDVSAPGQLVSSAVNNRQLAGWMNDYTTYRSQFNNETQYWTMFSGTSMAAPHVAGIIALFLQACPTLNPEQVRDILRRTSTRDAITGNDSNNSYGYGRINAFEGLKAAIELNRLSAGGKLNAELTVFPVPVQQSLFIRSEKLHNVTLTVEIFDASGRLVLNGKTALNQFGAGELPVSGLAAGHYMYRMTGPGVNAAGMLPVTH